MIKYWILDKFFKKDWESALAEAKRQGSIDAFKKAHADILETMADDLDDKAEELAKDKLKELLSPVDYRHVISVDKRTRTLFRGTEAMDAQMVGNLKSEAQFFKESDLWKLLSETPKMLAEQAMFVQGDIKSFEKGRSMLYTLDSQQKIIDTINSFTQPPHQG